MPFDDDDKPEPGISLFEVVLGIALALMVAPGVIWGGLILCGVVSNAWEALR